MANNHLDKDENLKHHPRPCEGPCSNEAWRGKYRSGAKRRAEHGRRQRRVFWCNGKGPIAQIVSAGC